MLNKLRQGLSLLLVILICLSLLPASSYAESSEVTDEPIQTSDNSQNDTNSEGTDIMPESDFPAEDIAVTVEDDDDSSSENKVTEKEVTSDSLPSISISGFTIQENEQVLSVGDTIHISVQIITEGVVETATVNLQKPDDSVVYLNLVFNSEDNLYHAEYTFTAEDCVGLYYCNCMSISITDSCTFSGGVSSQDGRVYLVDGEFDASAPVISNISCSASSENLTTDDFFTIRANISDTSPVTVCFVLKLPDSTTKVINPKYDSQEDCYKYTYYFDSTPGAYTITKLWAYDTFKNISEEENINTTFFVTVDGYAATGTLKSGHSWNLTSDGTFTVSGSGDMEYQSTYLIPWLSYKANIKKVIVEEGVTSIPLCAFSECSSLTEVSLPSTLKSIGESAFYRTGVKEILLPLSLESVGQNAFSDCTKLTSINIPSSVTFIGSGAFENCTKLTSVSLNANIAELSSCVFCQCTSLEEITLPSSITEIKDQVFLNCTSLKKIIFTGPYPSISSYHCFDSISGVAEVYCPCEYYSDYSSKLGTDSGNYIPVIRQHTLNDRSICIKCGCYPSGIACGDCGENAKWKLDTTGVLTVYGIGAMTDYSQSADAPWYDYKDSITGIVIESGITSVGSFAFGNCAYALSVSIPETIISIGQSAFSHSGLQTLSIPATVKEVKSNAFCYCNSLLSLTIESGNTSFDRNAFNSVWSVTDLTIPAAIDSRQIFPTANLHEVQTLHLTGSGAMFDYSVNYYPTWASTEPYSLKTVIIDDGITHVGSYAFTRCENITSISFPSSIESIGDYAFYNCIGLTGTLAIPGSVKIIGNLAFYDCSSITELLLSDGLESIGYSAFSGLSSLLESPTFPASLKIINDSAFHGCGFSAVFIPSTVEEIGCSPFGYCPNLISIEVADDNPYYSSYSDCLYNKEKTKLIQYPAGKSDTLVAIFPICCIGKAAFAGCKNIKELRVTYATSIEPAAFHSCQNLEKLLLPSSLSNIGDEMCLNCSSLKTINIPQTVTSIGSRAFESCRALTSVTIPENVNYIGDRAFSLCYALTELTIMSGNINFGEYVFEGASFDAQYPCTWVSIPQCADTSVQTWRPFHTLYYIDAKAPSISEQGNISYCECSACGCLFTDSTCSHEICIEDTILAPTGYRINYENVLDSDYNSNPQYHDGTKAITLQNLAREGYLFAGWYEDTEFNIKITVIPEGTRLDITLYAKWTPIKYSVQFNSNGGSGSMSSLSNKSYDIGYKLPINRFTRKGYTFVGWNTVKDGTGQAFINGDTFENLSSINGGKIILYAQWIANQYVIHFEANGGAGVIADQFFYYDAAQSLSENTFVREGYIFSGWKCGSKSYSDAQSVKNLTYQPDGVITLIAQWKADKTYPGYSYVITFDGNDATKGSMKQQKLNIGVTKALTSNSFSKTGYHFIGWAFTPDGSVALSNKEKVLDLNLDRSTGNIKLYAVWEPNSYVITFKGNGGKFYVSGSSKAISAYTQVTTYDLLDSFDINKFTRAGYAFSGWAKSSSAKTALYIDGQQSIFNLSTAKNGKVTLYAVWTPIEYSIAYNLNGGTNNPNNVNHYNIAATINLKSPFKFGYTFAGWHLTDVKITKLAAKTYYGGDIVLVAKWTPNSYTLVLNGNGGLIEGSKTKTITKLNSDTSVILPNLPDMDSYHFEGWSTVSNATEVTYVSGETVIYPEKNNAKIVLYAVWSVA